MRGSKDSLNVRVTLVFNEFHNIMNLVINIGNSVINIGSSEINGVRRSFTDFSLSAEQMLKAVNPPRWPKQISRCLRAEQKTLSRRQICWLYSIFSSYTSGFELPAEQQYQLPVRPLNDRCGLLPL